MNLQILNLIEKYEDEAINLRRYLHQNPEVSSNEFETSAYLKNYLSGLDFEIVSVPADKKGSGTGFIAIYDTGRPGKTVGLRSDIDALPVKESAQNLKGPRLVCSENDGVMHACGHDMHMATLVITGKILHELKDQLKGRFILIFEEGEENGAGIDGMVKLLKNYEIDAIYGNHVLPDLKTGQISVDPGPVMAGVAMVQFDVIGRGGHGSRPDLAINPLYAGVDILNSLAVAWSNQIDVTQTVTLGITTFQVGEAINVFSDRATIAGTLRYYDQEIGADAYNKLAHVVENVAKAHNCTIEHHPHSGPQHAPVVNDPKLASIAAQGFQDLFQKPVTEDVISFASESFTQYDEVAPYAFAFIGITNDEVGSGAGLHTDLFDADEKALKYSIGTMVKFAVNIMNS